jgi:hypothetical protein
MITVLITSPEWLEGLTEHGELEHGGGPVLKGQRQAKDPDKDLVPASSSANRLMTLTRLSGMFMSVMTKPGPKLIEPTLVAAGGPSVAAHVGFMPVGSYCTSTSRAGLIPIAAIG